MSNFVVSARKYRPTGFDEVVGQEHITTTLKNAIETNKLAQALLFCGPRGVGKTTCARIVARLINGFEEKTELNALNIFELDAASNNSVDDIRNLIDQVRYPPQYGKYKVYIIDEVHMLSNAAFNAFLKTLEEPPPYAVFILATTEKHKVIPTILSRCQIFDFNRIQISDIARHLKKIADREGIPAEEEALHLIAQKADGALRDALSIFDLMVTYSSGQGIRFADVLNTLHILDHDYYFKVVDALLAENHTEPLLLFDSVLRQGFDGHNFIVGLAEHFRNLLVAQDARTVELMEVPDSVRQRYATQASRTSTSLLLSWLNIASQCDINYRSSKNQRLTVELALMKMAYVNNLIHPEEPVAEVTGKKKSNEQLNPAKPEESTTVITENKPASEKPSYPETLRTSAPKPLRTPRISVLNRTTHEVKLVENEKPAETHSDMPVEEEQFRTAWKEFAEQRKAYQAEYHLLQQPLELKDNTAVLYLLNPVQETLLQDLKSQLTEYLRNRLRNKSIQIKGELKVSEGQTMLYTNRDKLNYMAEKNPMVRNLIKSLGLDPDF